MKRLLLLIVCAAGSLYGMDSSERQLLPSLTNGRVHPQGRRLPTKRLTLVPPSVSNGEHSASTSASSPNREPWDQHLMRFFKKPYTTTEEALLYLRGRDTFCVKGAEQLQELCELYARYTADSSSSSSSSGGTPKMPNGMMPMAHLSLDDMEGRYFIGRMLIDTLGGQKEYQADAALPFSLINTAASAGHVPAQIFLACSEQMGLTPRKRMIQLLHAFGEPLLSKGQRKQLFAVAKEYAAQGYVVPLIVRIAHAIDSGTVSQLFDELEANFPPVRIYDTDESVAAQVDFDLSTERWPGAACAAVCSLIRTLHKIQEVPAEHATLIAAMNDEIEKLTQLCTEHPSLRSLTGSCYSLLGRAYLLCAKQDAAYINKARSAHEKALNHCENEVTLMEYLRYMLHPLSRTNYTKKAVLNAVEEQIKRLIESAQNYKVSSWLIYAAFRAHTHEYEGARFFLDRAREQMIQEHHWDAREFDFYQAIDQEISEHMKKKTVAGIRKERQVINGRIDKTIKQSLDALKDLERKVLQDPVPVLIELGFMVRQFGLFGLTQISKSIDDAYNRIVVKAEQAEVDDNTLREERIRLITALKKDREKFEVSCRTQGPLRTIPIVLSDGMGGGSSSSAQQ